MSMIASYGGCNTWVFKLQLMDLRNRFLRYKGGDYIPFLANFPVAMFWGECRYDAGGCLQDYTKIATQSDVEMEG